MAVPNSFANGLLAGVFAIALTGAVIGCVPGPKQGPAAVAAATGPAWKVNSNASELRFVTTKNTNVAETQKFTRLDGGIAPGGAVSLAIDLASVETQDVTAALRVVRLKDDRLLVSARSPVLVSASDFDLADGIEQLRVLMGLTNIVGAVPVTFSIVFQTQS